MKNRVAAAVVSVVLAVMSSAFAQEDVFTQELADRLYERVTPAVCLLTYSSQVTDKATGELTSRDTRSLGLIVSADGLVMAHGHMQLEDAEPFNIRIKVGEGDSEQEYEGVLLKKPEDVNISFIRIKHDGTVRFPHVSFARGTSPKLGEPLLVFGLLGETLDFSRGLLTRRVAAVIEKPRETFCIDQSMPFGYVGGPVVNSDGEVLGVIGYDLAPSEGGELYIRSGHPLLYQTALFARYLDNPPGENEIDSGKPDAWLGVFSQPLTDDLAEYWGLSKNGGIVVSTIVAGSPAEIAGFQRGDVIISFNGTPMRAKQDREIVGFTKLVREAGIENEVNVKFLRQGEPMEIKLMLAERPKSARDAGEYVDEVFGLTVRELTTDVRILLNLSEDVQGVIVRRVKPGSWAHLARIRPGVIIMNFGDYPVSDLATFEEAIAKVVEQAPSEVSLFCRYGPRTGFFRMQPRWQEQK